MARTRSLLLLLTAALWLVGTTAQLVHEVVVQHVECAEHGGVVELGEHHAEANTIHFSISADDQAHEDGCHMDEGLVTATLAIPPATSVPVSALPPETRSGPVSAPRGPPLAFAPKTGPPATA